MCYVFLMLFLFRILFVSHIMELELSRVDYTLVGITAPQTMKLLPSIGTRMMQKVIIKFK